MRVVRQVHVFMCERRFKTLDALNQFVRQTYSEDGDPIASPFMAETGLSDYEPACIETYHGAHAPLAALLSGASYAAQWLAQMSPDLTADAALCIFAPNQLATPERSSLAYVGAFNYLD